MGRRSVVRGTATVGARVLAAVTAAVLVGLGGPAAAAPVATVPGTVLQLHPEGGRPAQALLQVGSEVVPVRSTLRSGTPVRAVATDEGWQVAGAAPRRTNAVAAGDRAHRVTLVMYAPRGLAADKTLATAVAAFGEAATYWREQTGGDVDLQLAASVDWRSGAPTCTGPTFWSEAGRLAGFTPGSGNHLLVVLPGKAYSAGPCALGLATIGGSVTSGGYSYVATSAWDVMAHELGHNLGLGHSNSLTCATASGDAAHPQLAGCSRQEYADGADVMASAGGRGSLNGQHLDTLGAGAATTVVTGTSDSTLVLSALAGGDAAAVRQVRVVDPSGGTLWLEYRTHSGRDAGLASGSTPYSAGVRVLTAAADSPRASLVLDPTPTGRRDRSEVLPAGTAWTSTSGRVRLTVTASVAASATVRVQTSATPFADAPAAPSAWVLSAGLSAGTVQAGRAVGVVGTLSRSGLAVGGVAVSAQQQAADGSWTTVRTGTTAANGVVAIGGLKPSATAVLRLVASPAAATATVASASATVRVSTAKVGKHSASGPLHITGHAGVASAVAGRKHPVVGRVTDAGGVGIGGVAVMLQQRPLGSTGAFTAGPKGKTNGTGTVVLPFVASDAAVEYLLVAVSGHTTAWASVPAPPATASLTLGRLPAVTASATATVPVVTPYPSGARVRLDTRALDASGRVTGSWVEGPAADVTVVDAAKGTGTVPLRLAAGRYELRAVRLDGAVLTGSTSKAVKLTVT